MRSTFFPQEGSLTFFTGPMSCGKTLELIRHLHIFEQQQIPTICLRPSTDTRTKHVQSRAGLLRDAINLLPDDIDTLKTHLSQAQVIGIDECQLFSPLIVPFLIDALKQDKTILVAGLDTDFRGQLFPVSAALLAIPETNIIRHRAICHVCHRYNATRTQRLRHNLPVPSSDPQVLIEGSTEGVTYEARCLAHHQI